MKVKDILGSNPLKKRHRGPHRKPRYRGRDLHEGGAMAGVGAIHISEIEPTLIKLEKEFSLDTNLVNELKSLNHQLKFVNSMNRVDAILIKNKTLFGGADKRGDDYVSYF